MKLRKDIVIKKLGENKIVHINNLSGKSQTAIVSINHSAEWLFDALRDSPFSEEDAVNKLRAHYDVSEEDAKRDVQKWIHDMTLAGIIEE